MTYIKGYHVIVPSDVARKLHEKCEPVGLVVSVKETYIACRCTACIEYTFPK